YRAGARSSPDSIARSLQWCARWRFALPRPERRHHCRVHWQPAQKRPDQVSKKPGDVCRSRRSCNCNRPAIPCDAVAPCRSDAANARNLLIARRGFAETIAPSTARLARRWHTERIRRILQFFGGGRLDRFVDLRNQLRLLQGLSTDDELARKCSAFLHID